MKNLVNRIVGWFKPARVRKQDATAAGKKMKKGKDDASIYPMF